MTKEQKTKIRGLIGSMNGYHEELTKAQVAYDKAENALHQFINELPEDRDRMGEVTEETRLLRG